MTAGSPAPGDEDFKKGCPPEEVDCEIQTMTAEQRERATEIFNEKPCSGIQYLTDNGCLRPSPHNVEDIIDFLMKSQGMSKAHIGQFLGTRGELNEAVLTKLIGSLDCHNKNFVDCVRYLSYSPSLRLTLHRPVLHCVRMFFLEFFPPGEADPMYRMLEVFGNHVAAVNPGMFKTEDAPVVLSYSGTLPRSLGVCD